MAFMKRDKIQKIFLYVILISFIYPLLHATMYGIPFADDFSYTLSWQDFEGSIWKYLLWNVKDTYLNWQGTYFSALIGGIPTYYLGGLELLRIEMLINTALFFIAVYSCISSIIACMGITREKVHTVMLMCTIACLFYLLSRTKMEEIFYWRTGITGYTLPLSCALFCIACYFKYEMNVHRRWLLLGSVLAICAAGGALNIAAFLCAVLLFGIVYNFVVLKKIEKNILIGIAAFLGALANAVAPGNFARHAIVDSEVRLMETLWVTMVRVSDTIADGFQNGMLLVIVVVVFLIAYKNLGESEFQFKYPGLVLIYGLFAIYITDFPVVLGYSGKLMPDRCVFVEQFAVILWCIIATIYWAGWASGKKVFAFSKEWYLVIAIICMIPMTSYLSISKLIEFTPYKVAYNIKNGNFKVLSSRQEDVIRQLENAEEKDVIVYEYKSDETEWACINRVGITENAEHWINLAVADYYDKDSVVVQYITE